MNRARRLGRGLEALLGQIPMAAEQVPEAAMLDVPHSPEDDPARTEPPVESELGALDDDPASGTPAAIQPQLPGGSSLVSVELIESNPAQPRQDFDPAEIQSLSESITTHGFLQPLVVRRFEDRYQLVAGERRLRAARASGMTEVPVNVVDVDDRQLAELAIVENLQRKDLNPLEKAASFQRYLEQYGSTQEELAKRLSLDRSTIANLIRLLELPGAVCESLRKGHISQGHARALLPLGDEQEQTAFCERIQREGLNVRQTEALVQETIANDEPKLGMIDRDGNQTRPQRVQSEHVRALEQELKSALGMKVGLTHNAKGRGKLVVHFRNHDEFERLRRHITEPLHAESEAKAG